MEMEHINENLIRINISFTDLEARGINFIELLEDRNGIEQFFYSLLEEAEIDDYFQESDAVTFQVIPNRKGLEVYVSRSDWSEDGEFVNPWEEQITRRLFGLDSELDKHHEKNDQNYRLSDVFEELFSDIVDSDSDTELMTTKHDTEVIKFEKLDDFLMLARQQPLKSIKTNLYHMEGDYYLTVKTDELSKLSDNDAESLLLFVHNFGEPSDITEHLLQEHGELIREGDALVFFGENI